MKLFLSLLSVYFMLSVFGCNGTKSKDLIKKYPDKIIKESDNKKSKTKVGIKIDYDSSQWKEIIPDEFNIELDLRYATTNNFVNRVLYDCPRCFLRPEVVVELKKINEQLLIKGYKLKLFDCYRPRPVQQKLWDIVPDARYVTPPWKGSMHNRGMAVDLTLIDMKNNELDMGTGFDFFGEKAYHSFKNLPENILNNRSLLKTIMENHGFKSIRTEWWHYSFVNAKYPLSDWVWTCMK